MRVAIMLALVAGVCLAGVASASPVTEYKFDFASVLCDSCKALVEKVQEGLPAVRPQLDQLCNYCGSPENNQKCLDTLHKFEDALQQEPPQEVCTAVGLCSGPGAPRNFVDFMGRF